MERGTAAAARAAEKSAAGKAAKPQKHLPSAKRRLLEGRQDEVGLLFIFIVIFLIIHYWSLDIIFQLQEEVGAPARC